MAKELLLVLLVCCLVASMAVVNALVAVASTSN
jgi:hypothetical protein